MIGKKIKRNNDEETHPKNNNDNKKKGKNIKELKEQLLSEKNNLNNNNNSLNEEKNKTNNQPKYTKYSDNSSSSENNNNSENESPKNSPKKISPKKNIKTKNTEKSHPEFTKSSKQNYTLSILIPSSIVDNAQSKELRTYLIGELARTIGIFKISEVIIFHDKLKNNESKDYINYFVKNLQYLETPQYLRKTLFPMSEDLKLSGLMNPLESQHHLRKDEWFPYREGCVLNRPCNGEYSWVNIGLNKDCKINQKLPVGTRVTIKLNEKFFDEKLKFYSGKTVSMSEPFLQTGAYWGYYIRVCENYNDVIKGCIYENGYDFIIGTSDKGENYRSANFEKYKNFKHCLIVFGGISGIEGMINDDEHNNINNENEVGKVFDLYLNTCMNQGLRTIRTEEAILISLAVIRPELDRIKNINY